MGKKTTTDTIAIENAEIGQIDGVKRLLKNSDLPYKDIDGHFANFIIAITKGEMTGVIGMEDYGNIALLRSFAVEKEHRSNGVGKLLLQRLFSISKQKGIKELYLLTTTADGYFSKFGFKKVDREQLPEKIKSTAEFKSLCPVSSVCMSFSLCS
jgi:amino-acid N-acetyltransferase